MNTLWLDKYTPTTLSDIVGHTDSIRKIKKWLNTFSNNNSEEYNFGSIIISGIHGIGKSITIKLILKELNYNIITVSSSNIKDNKILLNERYQKKIQKPQTMEGWSIR